MQKLLKHIIICITALLFCFETTQGQNASISILPVPSFDVSNNKDTLKEYIALCCLNGKDYTIHKTKLFYRLDTIYRNQKISWIGFRMRTKSQKDFLILKGIKSPQKQSLTSICTTPLTGIIKFYTIQRFIFCGFRKFQQ